MLLLWLCFPFFCFCQNNTSLVRGSSPLSKGVWSLQENISGTAQVQHKSLSVLYQNSFAIPELSKSSIHFILPTKHAVLGFDFNYSGDFLYNTKSGGFSLAKSFDEKLMLGFKSSFQSLSIQSQTDYFFEFELGSIYKFNSKVDVGFHLKNSLSSSNNQEVYVALGYHFSKKLEGILFVEKKGINPFSLNTQINYYLLPSLDLAFVSSNKLENNQLGISYLFTNWSIHSFFSYHSFLGLSTMVGFSYQWL